ncbi:MAG: von Willebrand factor type A domain-containing protein [Bacteroidales bacterium]|nr:von Willebrand factor type A domain-containing protein [Bacteroidales bacterium]
MKTKILSMLVFSVALWVFQGCAPHANVNTRAEMEVVRQQDLGFSTNDAMLASRTMAKVSPDGDFVERPLDRERYADREENAFKDVNIYPTSVFSVDVDNASYSNVRRYLNNSQLPPPGSVRVEEMINYFKYDYPAPKGDVPVALNAEIGKCPWNQGHYLMKIGLKARDIDTKKLPASNFVFLLDISGSMDEPNKLPLLVKSFKILLANLSENDRVSVITYAAGDSIWCEGVKCTDKGKDSISHTLERLHARGYTAGGGAIQKAYQLATKNFVKDGNNRVILATDGDFNVGISSTPALKQLIEKEREKGVYITVLGLGMYNLNDEMMSTIADAGNGNYYYIDNVSEAKRALGTELWGTVFTVAKDVKLLVDFNPNLVKGYRLIGYEKRLLSNEDFNDDKKDAGDMGAGHTVTALYELIPASSSEQIGTGGTSTPSEYVKTTPSGDKTNWLTVKFRYKNPTDTVSRMSQLKVDGSYLKKQNTNDFRLATLVAEFGMVLSDSKYCPVKLSEISEALKHIPSDEKGYVDELKVLVRKAADLKE